MLFGVSFGMSFLWKTIRSRWHVFTAIRCSKVWKPTELSTTDRTDPSTVDKLVKGNQTQTLYVVKVWLAFTLLFLYSFNEPFSAVKLSKIRMWSCHGLRRRNEAACASLFELKCTVWRYWQHRGKSVKIVTLKCAHSSERMIVTCGIHILRHLAATMPSRMNVSVVVHLCFLDV